MKTFFKFDVKIFFYQCKTTDSFKFAINYDFGGRETNENKRHAAEWCNFCNSKVRVGQHNSVKAQKVFQGSDCVVVVA